MAGGVHHPPRLRGANLMAARAGERVQEIEEVAHVRSDEWLGQLRLRLGEEGRAP